MISGWPLVFSSLFLSAWLLVLLWITWRVIRTPRGGSGRIWLTRMGLSCASLAILALLGLHLTWISPDISQKLGVGTVHVFAVLVFYSTIAGVVLNLAGSGTTRFVGLASCVATGIWWFVLLTGAALSMGSVTARHATRYLIPSGYVGWVRVEYGVGGPPLERSKGTYICRVPPSGVVMTSSPMEDGWASDEYFYYLPDGSLTKLPDTGWGKGGMIWAGTISSDQETREKTPNRATERFYVGTESQFHALDSH